VCAQCEKPFLGQKHYEKNGHAYCETHYNQLFGDVCYHCNEVIDGDGKRPCSRVGVGGGLIPLLFAARDGHCCHLSALKLFSESVKKKNFST